MTANQFSPKSLFAPSALLPEGWAKNVRIALDHKGIITDVATNQQPAGSEAEQINGVVIPGMPNCHSHAFQRAMAGMTEVSSSSGGDDFWSWRELMYRFLAIIGPEEQQTIAAQLYVEMLKAGYTSVAEFHYLHHNLDGTAYDDPAEMSHRIAAAASETGIQLTLLPVLYHYGDFGNQLPGPQQQRFVHDIEAFARLLEQLSNQYCGSPNISCGMALHSLRAVNEPLMQRSLSVLDSLDKTAPIHIHIAEQKREVEACLANTGQRPVDWLLDHADVNERWCLVHATHLSNKECLRLAASGAVAGLCLSTEANLGDGLFPAQDYLAAGGHFAIGSDSHVSVSPVEELRLLEYGQRLLHRRRTLLTTAASPSVGGTIYRQALRGGVQALAINSGAIEKGQRADLVALDNEDPVLYGKQGDQLLDAWLFATQRPAVKDVMVAGQWQVRNGRHRDEERIRLNFFQLIRSLRQHDLDSNKH